MTLSAFRGTGQGFRKTSLRCNGSDLVPGSVALGHLPGLFSLQVVQEWWVWGEDQRGGAFLITPCQAWLLCHVTSSVDLDHPAEVVLPGFSSPNLFVFFRKACISILAFWIGPDSGGPSPGRESPETPCVTHLHRLPPHEVAGVHGRHRLPAPRAPDLPRRHRVRPTGLRPRLVRPRP